MTRTELLALVRVLADDETEPYLLKNDKALLFIKEAEREAAERALYLKLEASHNLAVKANKASYELCPSIIFIDRAKLDGIAAPLVQTTRGYLDHHAEAWEDRVGTPMYFFIEQQQLVLCPTPDKPFTLQLQGCRRPVEDMETPEQYHEKLAHWVLYRFYSLRDADIYSPEKAADHLKEFDLVFGKKRKASFDEAWRSGGKEHGFFNP